MKNELHEVSSSRFIRTMIASLCSLTSASALAYALPTVPELFAQSFAEESAAVLFILRFVLGAMFLSSVINLLKHVCAAAEWKTSAEENDPSDGRDSQLARSQLEADLCDAKKHWDAALPIAIGTVIARVSVPTILTNAVDLKASIAMANVAVVIVLVEVVTTWAIVYFLRGDIAALSVLESSNI